MEASWRRLGPSWTRLGRFTALHACARLCTGAGVQRPPIRILKEFPGIIFLIKYIHPKSFRIILEWPLRLRHRAPEPGGSRRKQRLEAPKTPPRRLQDAFKFSSFFGCLFGSILAPFSLPTWSRKSRKIDQKSMPRWLPMLTSFLDRFFLDFCSQLGPSEPHLELAG